MIIVMPPGPHLLGLKKTLLQLGRNCFRLRRSNYLECPSSKIPSKIAVRRCSEQLMILIFSYIFWLSKLHFFCSFFPHSRWSLWIMKHLQAPRAPLTLRRPPRGQALGASITFSPAMVRSRILHIKHSRIMFKYKTIKYYGWYKDLSINCYGRFIYCFTKPCQSQIPCKKNRPRAGTCRDSSRKRL